MKFTSKIFLMISISLLNIAITQAQTKIDSTNIKAVAGRIITTRFPTTRTVNLEYEYVVPLNVTTKTHGGNIIEKGRLSNQNRVKLDMNMPFLRVNKWTFTGSFRYRYNYFDLDRVSHQSTQYLSQSHNHSQEGSTYVGGLNSTYISKLFDKPLIFNMTLNADFSQNGFERITGMGIATMVLKKNSKMAFSLGLFAMIDPMIHYPILPIVVFDYKLPNSWSFSVTLPQYVYIRKTFSKNNRLSFGTNITSDTYYLRLGDPKHSYRYNKAEIKTGFVYEHYVNQHFILTARGGMMNALKGTLNRRSNSYNKYIMKSYQNAGLFFNVGVSYNIY